MMCESPLVGIIQSSTHLNAHNERLARCQQTVAIDHVLQRTAK